MERNPFLGFENSKIEGRSMYVCLKGLKGTKGKGGVLAV